MALPSTPFIVGAPSRQVDPASFASTITPDDDTDLEVIPRFISIAKTTDALANVAVVMEGQTTTTTLTLACGRLHSLRVRRVMATGTTATQVIAYW